jgi:acyl-CoA thioester hydrolase
MAEIVNRQNVMTSRTARSLRGDYPHLHLITTRWHDNDVYGHVNNVQYYAFFDTVVNQFLLKREVLDIAHGEVIGLVVETGCRYFAPIAFPDTVIAGLRVARIGNSSVRYEIGLFRGETTDTIDVFASSEAEALAEGHFVHVYVDRLSRRPKSLPPKLREALESIQRVLF